MNVPLRFLIATVLLVVSVGTGISISHHGKPYPAILFFFHKLMSVAMTLYTLILIIGLLGMRRVEFWLALLLLIGGLSIVILFVSGVLISMDRISLDQATAVHAFAAVLMIVTVGTFLLLTIWWTAGKPSWTVAATPRHAVSSGEKERKM